MGSSAAQEGLLNSWKEIASYLNRGVRTVQRWEAELGLPVRRPRGKNRSAVIAMRSEIDEWLKSCPASARMSSQHHAATVLDTLQEATRLSSLIVEARELLKEAKHRRQELSTAVFEIRSSVRSISSRMRPLGQAQPQVPPR